jgi:transporter family-2 protein
MIGLAAAVLIGGILVAAQGPIYARLAGGLNDNPLAAAFLAFFTAAIFLGLILLAPGFERPKLPHLARLPPWVWLGGVFGAYQVIVSMIAVPRLGVTLFIMIVVLGNMLGGSLYDHFGMFGLERRPLTIGSALGIGFMFLGVLIKVRSS